jgi:predicted RNA-binding protein YlxR (DUF448 family)
MTKQGAVKPRRVPQRTCIACRSTESKRGLVRVVRTPEGRVALDPTGKANGRGAYIHESRACWDDALKKERLARALKIAPAAGDIEQLKAHAETLPSAT